ncbi:unnamed protein product [Sphagnum troendelagicum]
MASYGKPTAPPYNKGQSWQQQQTPSYAAQSGSSYYGQSTQPSPYGQQQTQYGQAPSSAYSSYGQQPSAYSSYGQQPSGYSSYGQTTYPPYGQTSYGQVPSSRVRFPPGTEPEIVSVFEMADTDGSGTIDAKELARVLSVYSPFSPRTVRLMLHIYADNSYNTTSIGPVGFVPLWRAIKQWQIVFERFDRDRSGTIELNELREALRSLGFNIPSQVLQILVSTYDTTGRGRSIEYDNFIECGLIVKGLSEKFKEKDINLQGSATLDYETFMLMVLPFIVA